MSTIAQIADTVPATALTGAIVAARDADTLDPADLLALETGRVIAVTSPKGTVTLWIAPDTRDGFVARRTAEVDRAMEAVVGPRVEAAIRAGWSAERFIPADMRVFRWHVIDQHRVFGGGRWVPGTVPYAVGECDANDVLRAERAGTLAARYHEDSPRARTRVFATMLARPVTLDTSASIFLMEVRGAAAPDILKRITAAVDRAVDRARSKCGIFAATAEMRAAAGFDLAAEVADGRATEIPGAPGWHLVCPWRERASALLAA